MLAEQGIQGQNGSLQIGPEEILPADAFQIGLGVDADGPLIFADEAAGIIPVQEAELGPEAHHGDNVNVTQELAVITVEQVCFCRQVKESQAIHGQFFGHIVDVLDKDLAGVAGHQEHHAVVDQLFQPVPVGPQRFDDPPLNGLRHGTHQHHIRPVLRKIRGVRQGREDKIRLRQALAQIFYVLKIAAEVADFAKKHFNFHFSASPFIRETRQF